MEASTGVIFMVKGKEVLFDTEHGPLQRNPLNKRAQPKTNGRRGERLATVYINQLLLGNLTHLGI